MNRNITRALTLVPVALASIALSGCPAQVVKEGIRSIPKATTAQCANDKDILDKAVQSYTLLEGKSPANEQALVPDYLHAVSLYWDLDAKANIIPRKGSPCT